MPHAVVVGGGISGLTAAFRLAARPGQRVTLLEADARLGGKIRTERDDGYVIEAGPDSFLAAKPAALALCRELGLEKHVIGTLPDGGGTFILRAGRLEPLPEGITLLVPTKLGPLLRSRLLSPRGKLRLGLDLLLPPRRDDGDESVAAFVRRRLGREAFERMAQPLLSGIYAGDAEQLSILSTFPRLRETERRHGSLIRGMLAQRRAAPAPSNAARSGFLSLEGGLQDLVDTLADRLTGCENVDVRTGTAATGIAARPDGGYALTLGNGERLEADAVLVATPADAASALLAGIDPALAAALAEIPYVSSATVALAYPRAAVAGLGGGRGFVVPQVEGRELTAVTWVTGKFAGRAPEGMALVRGFVGRAGQEAAVRLPDDELIALVRRELRDILGLAAEPARAWVARWERAMPQYVLGHQERLARIEARVAAHPGLALLGAAYRGVGIPDCIQSGEEAAQRVVDTLETADSSSAQDAAPTD
ncbi:MAG TPA: protoporphyrinogen oxidase [Thermomicrobiaceae bacterium]|nr:protoporphyrinogen oxidase [Thermomicrobiaceae bacterium]